MTTETTDLMQAVRDLAVSHQNLTETLNRLIADAVKAARTETLGDQWARPWGETVTQTPAAKMLGRSRATVHTMVHDGRLPADPTGAVITRKAAEWAESGNRKKRRTRA